MVIMGETSGVMLGMGGAPHLNPFLPFFLLHFVRVQVEYLHFLHMSLAFAKVVHFSGHGFTVERSQHHTPFSPLFVVHFENLHWRRKMQAVHFLLTFFSDRRVRRLQIHGQERRARAAGRKSSTKSSALSREAAAKTKSRANTKNFMMANVTRISWNELQLR